MAYEISNYAVKITLVAAADLSSNQYNFVKLDSTGKAAAVTATTDRPIGILQNAPTLGQEAEVLVVGGSKLVAGGAITEGAVIGTSAAGKGSALTIGGSSGTAFYILGTSLEEVSAANSVTTVVVNCASAARGF
jgi:hypothetical protein